MKLFIVEMVETGQKFWLNIVSYNFILFMTLERCKKTANIC